MPKKTQCAYCGKYNATTRDHIPPRNLFSKPLPDDALTVPCCKICCDKWGSKDDEYFRTVILSGVNFENEPRIKQPWLSVLRSVRKPQKVGFAKNILSSLIDIDVETQASVYLGKEPAFNYERTRISKVIERIIRALFFLEYEKPVPQEYKVDGGIDQFSEISNDFVKKVNFKPPKFAWNNQFAYRFTSLPEDVDSSVWLFTLYERVSFIGWTRKNSYQ